ncbi:MAG TPA: hypothetical protein VEA41_15340 [Salinarimonas sp.]|nr:hypothetical protein [Salinarimonas sp.]
MDVIRTLRFAGDENQLTRLRVIEALVDSYCLGQRPLLVTLSARDALCLWHQSTTVACDDGFAMDTPVGRVAFMVSNTTKPREIDVLAEDGPVR